MKRVTLKRLLLCVALTGFMAGSLNAQTMSFRQATEDEGNAIGVGGKGGVPVFADFDNNGFMDVFNSGETYEWQPKVGETNEDGTQKWEWQWWDNNFIGFNNGDGTFTSKSNASEIGLPVYYGGLGSRAFDFNQDGYTDFLLLSSSGGWKGFAKNAILLVINNGDGTFTVKDDAALATVEPNNNSCRVNSGKATCCLSIADFNKDGYPDALFQTEGNYNGGWARMTKLFVNKGGDHFELLEEPFIPQCSGSVSFGDFNNDGWPDIVSTGWCDGNADLGLSGGNYMHLYRNMKDGSFELATTDIDADIETAGKKWGFGDDAILYVLDYDQDGKQDMLCIGGVGGDIKGNKEWSQNNKRSILLRNISTDDKFAFEEFETNIYPASGAPERLSMLADFNGDGWVDHIIYGWNGDWHLNASSSQGSYDAYERNDLSDFKTWEGRNTFGDLNNDGLLEVVCCDDNNRLTYNVNTTNVSQIEVPGIPTDVAAAYDAEAKTMTVTWTGTATSTGSKAIYNVYLKNKDTGKVFMLAPADIESGKQRAYTAFSTYVSGTEYVFGNVEVDNYEIGVQAVAYSWQASAFATTDVLMVVDVPAAVAPELSMVGYGYIPFTVTTSESYILPNAEFDEWGGVVSLKGEAPYIVKKGSTEKVLETMMVSEGNTNQDLSVIFMSETGLGAGTYEFVIPKGTYCCPESKDDYMNCVVSGVYNAEHRYEFTIEPSAAVQVYESIPGYGERVKSVKEVSVVLSTEAALNTEADAPVAYLQLVGSEDKIAYTSAAVNAENAKMITFTFDEITAEGDYNIIVPEKAFVTVDGDWNAEYMSQFEVNSHEAKVNGTVTPGEGTYETITMEQEFKVTFDAPVTLNENAPQQVIFRNRMAQVVAFMTLSENGTEATIKAGEDIEMMGVYTLVIPEETVLDADGNWNFEITAAYTVTGKPAEYTMVPADGSEVTSLKEFTLTEAASCGIDYNCTATIKLYNSEDAVVAEVATADFEDNAIQEGENFWDPIVGYKIVLKDEITAPGTYKLVIPAGMFIVTANDVANEELTYTFAVNNPVTAEITPEAGTEFETITAENTFTVEFSKDVTLAENAQVYFKPMMGRQRFAATMVVEGNKGTITPSVEIKEAGRYSLVIEAKAVTDAEGNWNAYTEVAYNVTGAPLAETYKPISITPAEGTVTSLKNFVLKFEAGTYAFPYVEFTEVVYLENKDTQEKVNATLDMGEEPYDNVVITLTEEVTAAGTYTLVIPAKAVVQTEDDWGNGTVAVSPALTYEFTIGGATGIDAIFADGATADVYTVGGVLVKKGATREDVKSLKKGMYIINGQTVLLK